MDVNRNVLEYLKRVQALAKIGLTYAESNYDIERYEELRDSTHDLLSQVSNLELADLNFYFNKLDAYPTPKIDVRGVVMRDGKILLIQERADSKWAMPGGWCDIGHSPKENMEKEIWEEAGLRLTVKRVLAVWDKSKHDHPPAPEYVYKLNFLCEDNGESLNPGHETLAAGFFDIDDLPPLSEERNTKNQIMRLLELVESGEVAFD